MVVLKIGILIIGICFILLFGLVFFCRFALRKKAKILKLIGKGDYFKGLHIFGILIKMYYNNWHNCVGFMYFIYLWSGTFNNFIIEKTNKQFIKEHCNKYNTLFY